MRKIAIIGAGPAGFMAGIRCKELYPNFDVTIFDSAKPLAKLLLTGGGRCNICNAIFDFKELAKNYPRGEKFLYSIFNKFDTSDLFNFFEKANIDLYIQNDNRVFPNTNSAKTIRGALLAIAQQKNIKIKPNFKINELEKKQNSFILNKTLQFDNVIIATGNNRSGIRLVEALGHKIIALEPTLCGIKTKNPAPELSGVSIKAIGTVDKAEFSGELLFTHSGVSGPMIMDISSILAYKKFPYTLKLNFTSLKQDSQEQELLEIFYNHPKKNISNLLTKYLPHSLIENFLEESNIPKEKKAGEISRKERAKIASFLTKKELILIKKEPNFMVMAGGVALDEVDNNLESKIIKGLYFAGEILDIDGLCGGFNLQACFSTGFVAGNLSGLDKKGEKYAKS